MPIFLLPGLPKLLRHDCSVTGPGQSALTRTPLRARLALAATRVKSEHSCLSLQHKRSPRERGLCRQSSRYEDYTVAAAYNFFGQYELAEQKRLREVDSNHVIEFRQRIVSIARTTGHSGRVGSPGLSDAAGISCDGTNNSRTVQLRW